MDYNALTIDEFSEHVSRMVGARTLTGADGLYFVAANVAAVLTKAKHAVVVVPEATDMLRVAGCWGEPTVPLEVFPAKRGLIGDVYRMMKARKIDNVAENTDVYYPFDENVKSELAVPLLDACRTNVQAIINVEAYNTHHFKDWQIDLLQKIGRVMLLCRDQIARYIALHDEYSLEQRDRDHWYGILEDLPDEVMIIDTKYRPVYANRVKRTHFPDLPAAIQHNTQLRRLFLPASDAEGKASGPGPTGTCHWIIEKSEHRCEQCVCKLAMASRKAVQGVVYKPPALDFIAELSAAPLFAGNEIVGCVEVARIVTQREKVVDLVPKLWHGHTHVGVLESIVDALHDQLGYDRVRLYSVDMDSGRLKGVTYAGRHSRITKAEFSGFSCQAPPAVLSALSDKKKAGLLVIGTEGISEESRGYWLTSVTGTDVETNIDPDGTLDLRDIAQLAVVPLIDANRPRVLILDWKLHPAKRFTYDDLQALTVYSSLASAALDSVRHGELRSKMAVLGETTAEFVHQVRFMVHALSAKPYAAIALGKLLSAVACRLRADTRESRRFFADVLDDMTGQLGCTQPLGVKGPNDQWAQQLISGLRQAGLGIYASDAYTLAGVGQQTDERRAEWIAALTQEGDASAVELLVLLERLIIALKATDYYVSDLRAYSDGLRKFVPEAGSAPDQLDKPEILELVSVAVRTVDALARRQDVTIEVSCPEAVMAHIPEPGQVFLALLTLLENAVVAARGGQPYALVRLTVGMSANECFLSVANNGDRIPPSKLELLFREPFTTKQHGHGLGLIFAAEWIRANGGDIRHTYESETATTRFTIRLTRSDAPVAPVRTEQED